jgi:hypothetical protein
MKNWFWILFVLCVPHQFDLVSPDLRSLQFSIFCSWSRTTCFPSFAHRLFLTRKERRLYFPLPVHASQGVGNFILPLDLFFSASTLPLRCSQPSTPLSQCHTRFLRPKPDAHRMYAKDQIVIHMVRM